MTDYAAEEQKIEQVLNSFASLTLKELDKVQMLNRIDTKFVFHIKQFADILREIEPHYLVLEINGKRMFSYESLYFDTPDFLLYRFHHNGKLNRLKARYRRYADSGLCYFEVKYKVKGERTDKKRLKTPGIAHQLTEKELALVYHPYADISGLEEKMWIFFKRITLANRNFKERLTLDLNVAFDNNKCQRAFPELVVAEVKTDKSSHGSPIVKAFKKRHFEQVGFSKYATGVALLEPVKSNAFKPNFIKIEKIIQRYG